MGFEWPNDCEMVLLEAYHFPNHVNKTMIFKFPWGEMCASLGSLRAMDLRVMGPIGLSELHQNDRGVDLTDSIHRTRYILRTLLALASRDLERDRPNSYDYIAAVVTPSFP